MDNKDVNKHKKGLTTKQKKQWVEAANSVLEKCLKDGEEDCDAKAIRQANGIFNIEHINTNQQSYKAETKEKDGKNYLIVPVVMMVEGVHTGSAGPIYHQPEELEKTLSDWENIPITLSHPINNNGEFISINGVENKWQIGNIHNARMEDKKLRADAWIDIQRLAAMSSDSLKLIEKGEMIEVSVGIFSEELQEEGDWNGEHYIAISTNYEPDHLALLPGEVGACSLDDGCGIRLNKEGGNADLKPNEFLKKGLDTLSSLETLDQETLDLIDQLNEAREKISPTQKQTVMCEKCPEKAGELIAHTSTQFSESDREWLESLTEDKLDKLIPIQTNAKPEPVTVDKAWEVIQTNVKDDDYLQHLPNPVKNQFETGVKFYKEQRNTTIQSILDKTEDTWTKEELEGMKLDVLTKLDKSVKSKVNNYSGANAGQNGKQEIMPMPIPGVEFDN